MGLGGEIVRQILPVDKYAMCCEQRLLLLSNFYRLQVIKHILTYNILFLLSRDLQKYTGTPKFLYQYNGI